MPTTRWAGAGPSCISGPCPPARSSVRVGGGPDTIRQFLRAQLIDEMHLAIVPVLLGQGERLLEGVDLRALGYECVQHVASEAATHVVLQRRARERAA